LDSESISNIIACIAIFIQIFFSSVECLGTLILASIALFGPVWVERRKRKVFGPIPKIRYDKISPYYLVYNGSDFRNPNHTQRPYKIVIRIGLYNSGDTKLQNCEVILKSYEHFDIKSNRWEDIELYKYTNLNWWGVIDKEQNYCTDIHPRREKFVEFGEYYLLNPSPAQEGVPSLCMNIIRQGTRLFLNNGLHRMKIVFYGDNIKPYEKTLLLKLNGHYEPEEHELDSFVTIEIL